MTVYGSIDAVSLTEGDGPVRFHLPVRSVSVVDGTIALVVGAARDGQKNLLVLGVAGEELARLGTTCGTGYIYHVFEVAGEIRVVEFTRDGDFQALLDLDAFTLERIGEWR